MPRRVFFSFHYERDIWRANVIRNSWVTHEDRQAAGFWDASLWEEAKKKGEAAIRRMIDTALIGTSVTAVLSGFDTANREWVLYEIQKSYKRGNGLLGVYINRIADQDGRKDPRGDNSFNRLSIQDPRTGKRTYLSELYPMYDWDTDDGYRDFGIWVERAARAAGR